jgi:hypothetical protein
MLLCGAYLYYSICSVRMFYATVTKMSFVIFNTKFYVRTVCVCVCVGRWSVMLELCSVHNMNLISTKEQVSHAREESGLCIFHMFHGISWTMAVEWIGCLTTEHICWILKLFWVCWPFSLIDTNCSYSWVLKQWNMRPVFFPIHWLNGMEEVCVIWNLMIFLYHQHFLWWNVRLRWVVFYILLGGNRIRWCHHGLSHLTYFAG